MLPWAQGIVQGNRGSAYALSIPGAREVHNFCFGRVKRQAKGGKVGGQSVIASLQFDCIGKDRGAGAPEEVIIYKGTEGDVCAFEECEGRSCKQLCQDGRDRGPLGYAMVWLGSSRAAVSIERDGHRPV